MKIIIVGVGKVGYAIAEQMTGENHDIVIVDQSSAVLDHADSMLDVMCVEGTGASASVLLEANPLLAHKIMMDGGEVLRAPEMGQSEAADTLPPWKRGA